MPNPTPRVVELSAIFRAQLLARERAAATAMVRYYGETWRRLKVEIAKLQAEIAALVEAGKTISQEQLWQMERLKAITAQAEQELAKFAQFADPLIVAGKREAIIAGERNATALMQAAFPPSAGIGISFQHMPSEAVETLAGFLADGSPLRDTIFGYVGDAVDQFSETMVTGLAAGWNPRRLAKELRQSFGIGLTDSLRLSRTEQLRAYRTATLRSYNESGVVKGWERHAAKDERTCLACISLDGKRYTLAEEMDDHVAGRCLPTGEPVLTQSGWRHIENIKRGDYVMTHKGRLRMVTGTSRRLHEGEILLIRQGRHSARLTPDHRVMTSGGWLEASRVKADSKKASAYTGWVYDLQIDEDESFIAGGIAVHNCALLPVTLTFAEMGIDAPEPQFERETGQDWFRRQTEATQRRMMDGSISKEAFDAWQAGEFTLDDIPKLTESSVWGDSWTPAPLKDLAPGWKEEEG